MKNPKLTNRYAKALFDFAAEKGEIEAVSKDLSLIRKSLKDSAELHVFLNSPVIAPGTKHVIFSNIFRDRISSTTFIFLDIIIKKKREPALADICDEFTGFYNEHHHIKEATLVSAIPLNKSLVEQIRGILASKTGYDIKIQEVIRPGIIGGFRIKMGDNYLDASVISKINRLRQDFSHNMYQVNF